MIYDDKKFIGIVIKNARKKARLSQAELAEKIDMNEKNLGNIERGEQYPQLNNFFRILEALDLTVSDFGVKINIYNNKTLENLICKILTSTQEDMSLYLEIINLLKKYKK